MPTNREQALMLLALGMVCLTNDLPPTEGVPDKFKKQFVDHLLSHGVEKDRARQLYKLVEKEKE